MQKLIITGVLTLFIGSMAQAADTTFNTDAAVKTAASEPVEIPDVYGPYWDEGGKYYIISDSNSCRKVYKNLDNDTVEREIGPT